MIRIKNPFWACVLVTNLIVAEPLLASLPDATVRDCKRHDVDSEYLGPDERQLLNEHPGASLEMCHPISAPSGSLSLYTLHLPIRMELPGICRAEFWRAQIVNQPNRTIPLPAEAVAKLRTTFRTVGFKFSENEQCSTDSRYIPTYGLSAQQFVEWSAAWARIVQTESDWLRFAPEAEKLLTPAFTSAIRANSRDELQPTQLSFNVQEGVFIAHFRLTRMKPVIWTRLAEGRLTFLKYGLTD